MTFRIFKPIESFCGNWPQARFVVTSFLPDEIEFEASGGVVAICTDFVRPILESIPNMNQHIAHAISDRFNWIAKCMPMTLPTPVELQHFNGMIMTHSLMDELRRVLRQHQETRLELRLPTTMQLFHHGLGLNECPVPIDPDW